MFGSPWWRGGDFLIAGSATEPCRDRAGVSVRDADPVMSAGRNGGGVSSAISRALGAGDRDRAATLRCSRHHRRLRGIFSH